MEMNSDPTKCAYCDRKHENRKVEGHLVCQACYRVYRRNGKVERKGQNPAISKEVILGNVEEPTDLVCLKWKGNVDKDGYPRYFDGSLHAEGKEALIYVRRWLMEQKIGRKLEKGEIVEDWCEERSCVNEEHLLLATIGTGRRTQAGINSRKTHCENGHEYEVVGIYIEEGGRRKCMECRWEANLRHLGKNPAEFTRGVWNKYKTHCAQGHEYDEKNTGFNPDGSRWCRICAAASTRKRLYGITPDQYVAMREEQNDCCLICKKQFFHNGIRTSCNTDHCHDCGQVRGLICESCNKALGLFYDNEEALLAAAEYVRSHKLAVPH